MKNTYNKRIVNTEKTPSDMDNFNRYHKDLSTFEPISKEEEIDLANRIQKGDEDAFNELVQANLRLVILIAGEYEGLGLSSLDLISEGNLGLVKAAKRFDVNKDVKFSFYAGLWIRQHIKRALSNKSRTIRIPVSMIDKINTLEKQKNKDLYNGESDSLESSNDTEVNKVSNRLGRLINLAKTSYVSIDTQINDSEKSTLSDVIPDTNIEDPNESVTKVDDYDLIKDNLNDLNEREQQVIVNRFGLNDETPLKLIEIANKMGLTKERVRQIEEYALIKLRRLFYKKQGDNRFVCPT